MFRGNKMTPLGWILTIVVGVALLAFIGALIYGHCTDQSLGEVFKLIFNIGPEVVEEATEVTEEVVETASALVA